MKTSFLNPKLQGERFDEHTVPLDVLKDLAALQDLIVEVARVLYLRDHARRARVPRGFYEDFALHVSAIGAGSAVPTIDRVRPTAALPFAGVYDRARDLVLLAITAVALSNPLPPEFPRECLKLFDPFGRSLRADESVELIPPGQTSGPRYDARLRKEIVLRGGSEYRRTATLRGRVTAVDVERKTFTLTLFTGERVPGDYTAEFGARVVRAPEERPNGPKRVVVRSSVVFDRQDRPKKLEAMVHFDQLDPNDVPARVEELGALPEGWLDGDGTALPADGVEWLIDAWELSYPDDLPAPFTYPTPDGGVQFEWTVRDWELSAKVDLTSHEAEVSGLRLGTDDTVDLNVDLEHPEGWATLSELVRSRLPTGATMGPETLLLRQVHPTFLSNGRVSGQAFRLKKGDDGLLSVYDGDLTTGDEAWRHYTDELGFASAGACAVSVAQCVGLALPPRPDPAPHPAHAVLDCTAHGTTVMQKKAQALASFANGRAWAFKDPAQWSGN